MQIEDEEREKNWKKNLRSGEEMYMQHDYHDTNSLGSTFWISLKDFCKYFYICTICYHDFSHERFFCSDQVFSFKWGACYVDIPHTEMNTFVQLFQLNDRFMEVNELNMVDDYEYAEMTLIVTKVIKMPPKTGKNRSSRTLGECAYVDGVIADLYNTCHVKLKKMTAGRYIFFYSANFRRDQLCRKLNIVLNAPVSKAKI
jgi:hypothetical protein